MRSRRSCTSSKKRQRDLEENLRYRTFTGQRTTEPVTKFAKRVKQKAKQQAQDIETKQWEEKELDGRYPKRIREADVDDSKTKQWLRSTGLKGERGTDNCSPGPKRPTKSYNCKNCER